MSGNLRHISGMDIHCSLYHYHYVLIVNIIILVHMNEYNTLRHYLMLCYLAKKYIYLMGKFDRMLWCCS